ncbi:hypothetical protein O3W52_04630 [Ensifer psoraleae]|uniref:Uncharacterized protein n=1 Tax=Sinorhizobium psoraleae TaxID=520838 RepID=A0ABT4KBZ2_9HYPH|nr:hypothetical protein [Sinorhizobium psoraleae]
MEDDGWLRVRFPGAQYPVLINPDAVEQVTPAPKEKPQRLPKKFYDKPT